MSNDIKITVLGTGTSVGIPALGQLGWGKCDPSNPKNKRQRCAILIQSENTTILTSNSAPRARLLAIPPRPPVSRAQHTARIRVRVHQGREPPQLLEGHLGGQRYLGGWRASEPSEPYSDQKSVKILSEVKNICRNSAEVLNFEEFSTFSKIFN